MTQLWDRYCPKWRQPVAIKATDEDLKAITDGWKAKINELELIAKVRAEDKYRVPVENLDAVIQRRVARKRKGSWWLVPEGLRKSEPHNDDQVFEFQDGITLENVVDQKVSVCICFDAPNAESMPACEIFVQDGKLHVDCAPPLTRRYTAPVPKGAKFARSADHDGLAVFVLPSSELARLIQKLWEREDQRGGIGES